MVQIARRHRFSRESNVSENRQLPTVITNFVVFTEKKNEKEKFLKLATTLTR